MTTSLKLGLGAVAAVLALSTAGAVDSASALTVRVPDARNTPAAVDIATVTYRNGEFSARATVHVRDLHRAGRLRLLVGPVDADVMYRATVWVKRNGELGKRFQYLTNTGTATRSCRFTATWSASKNHVRVSVPHTCLRFGRFLTTEWFRASLRVGAHADIAAGRNVGRGSSPGCATAAEIRHIHNGMGKPRAQAILDTAGRFGDGGAGGYSRVYRSCGGGRGWFVEYDGRTNRVIGKGRVRA
jgi:hypothetical protein